jgi:alcohol dehydrogenase class IV
MGAKALVVTDHTMRELGHVDALAALLGGEGDGCAVFDGVNAEPTDAMADEGLARFQGEGCDFLVALGGGSPIDAMKAIAVLSAQGGPLPRFMGTPVERTRPPMAAIPTTAGTGSEATQFAVIIDTARGVKMLLKGPAFLPDLAIVDPLFTLTMPPSVTAATGVDALTHAIECCTSRAAQPLSDTFALSAVKRVFAHLRRACHTPGDIEARSEMSLASLEAGIALNNSSVTVVHGMSRPLGALFHVPHGLSNAMLLARCLEFIVDGAVERFATLARVAGAAGANDSDGDAARLLAIETARLLDDLGIPSPAEYGIPRAEFEANIPKMAADALASGSPSNTRKEITAADMERIYASMWKRRIMIKGKLAR